MLDNENIPNSQTLDSETKSKVKPWVWVVGIMVLCLCLSCAGLLGLLYYYGREPEGLSVSYSVPSSVNLNDEFDLTLTLTNTGNEAITIDEIDLDEAFGDSILDGCIVIETDPFMEKDYSIEGIKSFKLNRKLAPGETLEVTFRLQAVTPGEFGGSVGVYVGGISVRLDYVGIVILK